MHTVTQTYAETLSARRAKDREVMAQYLLVLARKAGAVAKRRDANPCRPHAEVLDIEAARGLRVSVALDGDRKAGNSADVYVLSWHFAPGRRAERLNPATLLCGVNPYHFGKATDVAYGFEDLCRKLVYTLQRAKDGTAFQEPHQEALVAHG
jgi:hypothetical protein